jgi:hypothetical protein
MIKVLLMLFVCHLSYGQNIVKDIVHDFKNWQQKRWDTEHITILDAKGLFVQNIQQQSFSQNQFSAIGISLFRAKNIDRPNIERGREQSVSFSPFLKSKDGDAKSMSVNSNFAGYYLLKFGGKWSAGMQANTALNVRFNQKYSNNLVASEVFLSLSPRMHYFKNFKLLKKEIGLDYTVSTALFNLGYNTPSFTANFTNDNFGLFLPNFYNNFDSRLLIKFPASRRIKIQNPILGYRYNLQTITPANGQKVINGSHSIYLIASILNYK